MENKDTKFVSMVEGIIVERKGQGLMQKQREEDSRGEAKAAEGQSTQDQIKNASNGPEHAKRRIEALDKMVFNLKSRRRKCGDAMESDTAGMAWIDRELERLDSQYAPICRRLTDNEQTMERVQAQLQLAEQTMLQIMGKTKSIARSGLLANSKMQKRQATTHLRNQRGFGMEPESTFVQRSRRPSGGSKGSR